MTFEEQRHVVEHLMDRRNLTAAHAAARRLVENFPDEIQAYFVLNLVCCLSRKAGGPQQTPVIIAEARARCPLTFTPIIEGDMLRDQVVGMVRFDTRRLRSAVPILAEIQALHAGDSNRSACLLDIRGRVFYARRLYDSAVAMHQRANESWEQLGDASDPVWVYNNWVHWLKARVATGGRDSAQAKWLVRNVQTKCPPASRNRSVEAQVILWPIVGNRLHDFIVRHR